MILKVSIATGTVYAVARFP